MAKVIGFCALHYGKEYLPYVVHQIYPVIDELFIAYAPTPSHGHASTLKCPDSKEELHNAVFAHGDPQNKIKWYEGKWQHEGEQRDSIFERCGDAKLISVFDSDEIWHTDQLQNTIDWCLKQPARNFKQKLTTPWRSFNYVCTDEMRPDRFYRPDQLKGTIAYIPQDISIFYHMGYAISSACCLYKLSCHGHQNEWRANWFAEKWSKWRPDNNVNDCHPTCKNTWEPKPFDKNLLPQIMRSHPYWSLDIIP
jgi:hypothetical protein